MDRNAFICLGRLKSGQHHAWIGTFEPKGAVRFWEPSTKNLYFDLPHRIAHVRFWNDMMRNKSRSCYDIISSVHELDEEVIRRMLMFIQNTVFRFYVRRPRVAKHWAGSIFGRMKKWSETDIDDE